VNVGRIISVRGVRGELKVFPLTDAPDFFSHITYVWLGPDESSATRRNVLHARFQKPYVILLLEGISDRTEAEACKGLELYVPVSDMPPLDEGLHYYYELEGLRVETVEGKVIGVLDHIMETGSNDVYVLKDHSGREVLIPATHEVVKKVDLDAGVIVVSPIEGLLQSD